MALTTTSREGILEAFLNRWPISQLPGMKLEEYVSVGNPDTFTQWLDTHTSKLGNIKGTNSSKFGIYKLLKSGSTSKVMKGDGIYLWSQKFGRTADEAFASIRNEVEQIAKFSSAGKFEEIDGLELHQFVKWKIAYLYSNGRIVPIFTKEVLHRIVHSFGVRISDKEPLSKIYKIIIDHKPAYQSTFQYARTLYNKYGKNAYASNANDETEKIKNKKSRKGTESKSTGKSTRKSIGEAEVNQRHNEIQNRFADILRKQYGKENVILEEDYVDIKVKQPKKYIFFEVKSSAFASDCIKEALGQLLSYTHHNTDGKTIDIRVVGENEATPDEVEFINYLKLNLKLDFDYITLKSE